MTGVRGLVLAVPVSASVRRILHGGAETPTGKGRSDRQRGTYHRAPICIIGRALFSVLVHAQNPAPDLELNFGSVCSVVRVSFVWTPSCPIISHRITSMQHVAEAVERLAGLLKALYQGVSASARPVPSAGLVDRCLGVIEHCIRHCVDSIYDRTLHAATNLLRGLFHQVSKHTRSAPLSSPTTFPSSQIAITITSSCAIVYPPWPPVPYLRPFPPFRRSITPSKP